MGVLWVSLEQEHLQSSQAAPLRREKRWGARGGPEEMAMAHEGILIPVSQQHPGRVPENEWS